MLAEHEVHQVTYTMLKPDKKIRVRLDFLYKKDNILRLSDTPSTNMVLMELAQRVCSLNVWDRGQQYAEKVCTADFLDIEVTALLGKPTSTQRKHFSDFTEQEDSLSDSRFATFEINFNTRLIAEMEMNDDQLDIDQ